MARTAAPAGRRRALGLACELSESHSRLMAQPSAAEHIYPTLPLSSSWLPMTWAEYHCKERWLTLENRRLQKTTKAQASKQRHRSLCSSPPSIELRRCSRELLWRAMAQRVRSHLGGRGRSRGTFPETGERAPVSLVRSTWRQTEESAAASREESAGERVLHLVRQGRR